MGIIGITGTGLFGGVKPDLKGKCIRKESFGCPAGTPIGLGCSPQRIATEVCYNLDGKVIIRKPLNFNEPYQTKSILERHISLMLGHPTKFGENCSSTNPTWVRATATSSRDKFGKPRVGINTCPAGYESAGSIGSACCKPIVAGVKVSDTVTKKPKTFIEKNSNLLIVGGIILGALLLIRK
jgi:hypothetical protein